MEPGQGGKSHSLRVQEEAAAMIHMSVIRSIPAGFRDSHCIHQCKVAEETENGCSRRDFAVEGGYAEVDLGKDTHHSLVA